MRALWLSLFMTSAFFASLGHATSANGPVDLLVASGAEDSVGQRLLYSLREKARASQTFRLTETKTPGAIRILVVTIDPDKPNGNRTVYSVTYMYWTSASQWVYLSSNVGSCGTKRIEECAESLLAEAASFLDAP